MGKGIFYMHRCQTQPPLLLLPLLPHLSPLPFPMPGLDSRVMSIYSVGYHRETKGYTQTTTWVLPLEYTGLPQDLL